jgi:hypothetical protein
MKCIWNPIYATRQYLYKGKFLHGDKPQRTGVCNYCRAVLGEINVQTNRLCKATHMNHEFYDDTNPEAHRIECCASCHTKYHKGVPPDRRCINCGCTNEDTQDNGYPHWYRMKGLDNEFKCRLCYEKERKRLKHLNKKV